MNESERWTAMIGAVGVALVSCGGGTNVSSETSPPTSAIVSEISTSSVLPTTTSTTSTSTTTTIPESVDVPLAEIVEFENFTIYIDQAILELDVTQVVVNAVNDILENYPLITPASGILYATTEQSRAWAQARSREVDCMYSSDVKQYSLYVAFASKCGFFMRVDAMESQCFGLAKTCKTAATVGVHEFFHVITAQILESCSCRLTEWGRPLPDWYNEGTAEYVGYVSVFGSDDQTVQSMIEQTKGRARQQVEIDVDLVEIESFWAILMEQPWQFPTLYERSFLAILFLVEQYGEQAVLSDYFFAITSTRNYETAFEMTFGKTIMEFSDEFDIWLDSL